MFSVSGLNYLHISVKKECPSKTHLIALFELIFAVLVDKFAIYVRTRGSKVRECQNSKMEEF